MATQDLLNKSVEVTMDEFRAVIHAISVEEMRIEQLRKAGLMTLIPSYEDTVSLLKVLTDKWANAEWVIK